MTSGSGDELQESIKGNPAKGKEKESLGKRLLLKQNKNKVWKVNLKKKIFIYN